MPKYYASKREIKEILWIADKAWIKEKKNIEKAHFFLYMPAAANNRIKYPENSYSIFK